MDKIFLQKLFQSHQACPTCPSPAEVSQFFTRLLGTLFPDFSHDSFSTLEEFETHLKVLQGELEEMLKNVLAKKSVDSKLVTNQFFESLPGIHQRLEHDVIAMFQGDPA